MRPSPALLDASPLKRDRIEGTDLLVVRELTGGIYFGDSGRDGDTAHDDCAYSVEEIERCHEMGHHGVNFGWDFQRIGYPALRDPHWEPILKTAEERGLSVNFHVGFNSETLEEDLAANAQAGLDSVKVGEITSAELGRPARRPANSVLRNTHLELTIGRHMRPWREALGHYLHHRAEAT